MPSIKGSNAAIAPAAQSTNSIEVHPPRTFGGLTAVSPTASGDTAATAASLKTSCPSFDCVTGLSDSIGTCRDAIEPADVAGDCTSAALLTSGNRICIGIATRVVIRSITSSATAERPGSHRGSIRLRAGTARQDATATLHTRWRNAADSRRDKETTIPAHPRMNPHLSVAATSRERSSV